MYGLCPFSANTLPNNFPIVSPSLYIITKIQNALIPNTFKCYKRIKSAQFKETNRDWIREDLKYIDWIKATAGN